MCGIIGCALRDGNAAPLIRKALERLEYRGYDSVGEATIDNSNLVIKKDQGKIADIHKKLDLDDLPGPTGIGHTRWATHGAPSQVNAHPHTDCKEKIAVVHNGIIENFVELREELERKGHKFKSRCDTEVIPHLIEENLNSDTDFIMAVRNTARRLEGTYAIAVLSVEKPDRLICIRKESPLVLGIGEEGNFCASDIPALLPLTRNIIYLNEGELAVLDPEGVELSDLESYTKRIPEIEEISWTVETAERAGYPHFMLKEINEQPETVKNALRTQEVYIDLMSTILDKADQVFLVAAGTAYHACLAGTYMFSELANLNAQAAIASEFKERYGKLIGKNSVILAVSQSGETMDTLSAIRYALDRGATVLGITNVMGSTVTRLTGIYIGQNSGPEIGVASTKAYTAQAMILARLAIKLGEKRKTISSDKVGKLNQTLKDMPSILERILKTQTNRTKDLATKYRDRESFCFLGRGIDYVTALEGRLKLLELAYPPSLAYPAGESKHGFIAVVEDGYPLIFIAPKTSTQNELIGNIMEMKARGGSIISITEEGDQKILALSDDFIEIPKGIPEILTPIPYILPLQLFAYYSALERNRDPDQPRNLAKSVTVK
ncbi:MAG: glutamine--fructose-6-phosphate transaminase (isomerizing) [Candidatus Bathyarchaeota archaeon]|nr:MAG: glutamine--fructose-6-phosphate transaminase (isomerizing) [Candidatus Bathyarchaeota archaeon]